MADIERAIDQSIDSIINIVADETITGLPDSQILSPSAIDYDERAIANAAYVAIAVLGNKEKQEVLADIAMNDPMLLRVSKAGDASSAFFKDIKNMAGSEERVIGVTALRNYILASSAENDAGPVSIGVDGDAVADTASDPKIKDTIAESIKKKICEGLLNWFKTKYNEIKNWVEQHGLKAALKLMKDKIAQIVGVAIAALTTTLSIPTWAAYLLIGLIVAMIGIAIYYVVKKGIPSYCTAE